MRDGSMLDGSEDSHLHYWLANIGVIASEYPNELRNECLELVFASNSEESFSEFGSD